VTWQQHQRDRAPIPTSSATATATSTASGTAESAQVGDVIINKIMHDPLMVANSLDECVETQKQTDRPQVFGANEPRQGTIPANLRYAVHLQTKTTVSGHNEADTLMLLARLAPAGKHQPDRQYQTAPILLSNCMRTPTAVP
jgi:hypothetical protein